MQDIRYLVFSAPEVQEALVVLLRNRDPSLVLGNAQCSLTGGRDDIQASLSFTARGAERRTLTLGAADLLPAAILFCKMHHVMLPMRAQKRVEMMNGALTLVMTTRIGAH